MSEQKTAVEEEKVEETTTQEAATEEQNDEEVENNGEGASSTEQEPEVDWKAEAERLQTERDNYREGMINAKDQLKKQKTDPEGKSTTQESDDDLAEKVGKIVSEQLSKFQTGLNANTVDSMLEKMTDNPDKRAVIKFHYENTINKTGTSTTDIERDLRNALAIADYGRTQKENSEIKTSAKNRKGVGSGDGKGSNKSKNQSNTDISKLKFSKNDESLIARMASRQGKSREEIIREHINDFTVQN